MADRANVIVYYSLQSDYCYFLLDRLLELQKSGVTVDVHWGVPLMVFQGETFYEQDRFDQLIWRMKERQAVQ